MAKKIDKNLWNIVCSVALLIMVSTADGQTANIQTETALVPAVKVETVVLQPVLTSYKGVSIGTAADEVREKLGKAEIDDKDGFYYRFSDDEFAQIRVDKGGKVRLLSIAYSAENAPKFLDVFGPSINMASKPDGSIYELIRYPEAGFWVAYSRTAGDKPRTTVTLQKLQVLK